MVWGVQKGAEKAKEGERESVGAVNHIIEVLKGFSGGEIEIELNKRGIL